MKAINKNLVYLFLIILITITPLVFIKNSEFGGADGKAEEIITKINPNYKPWAESPIESPGVETESLLFALQAALGSAVIFYIIGFYKGKTYADRQNSK